MPGATDSAVGDAAIVKFGSAVTFKVRVVVEVVEPLVPVTVTVAEPTVAVLDAEKVSVLPADPVTETGLKLAVTPEGNPLTLSATDPLNPPTEFTVTLLVADVPCMTVAPEAVTLNPGPLVAGTVGNAFCTNMVNSGIQNVPAFGEFARASVGILFARALSCAGSQFGSPVVEVTPLKTLPG